MEKIKVTEEGLIELQDKLENLKKEFDLNEKQMSVAYHNSNGDGAHDNAEFEYLLANERRLARAIDELALKIKNVEIIETIVMSEEIVNIGDTIEMEIYHEKNNSDIVTILLVGGDGNIFEGKVSINSPLGKAIYGKKVGELVTYNVAAKDMNAKIVKKLTNTSKKVK